MSGPISPHKVAIACGASGAYVDVTAYVELGQGITYTYGRPDQFSDVAPGAFGFTLNNQDGRFTPGSKILATSLVEGMGVSWLLGTRLVHSTIVSFEIPSDEARWDQIVIHCDDMLGNAGRYNLTNLPDMLAQRTGSVQLAWPMDETSGTSSVEASRSLLGAFNPSQPVGSGTQVATLGVQQAAGLPGSAVTVTAGVGEKTWYGTARGNQAVKTTIPYPKVTASTPTASSPSYGWWGFWVYPGSTISFNVYPHWASVGGYNDSWRVKVTPTDVTLQGGVNSGGAVVHTWTAAESLAPHYIFFDPFLVWQATPAYWALSANLFIDGTMITGGTFFQSAYTGYAQAGYQVPSAQLADGTAMQPVEVSFSVSNAAGTAPLTGTVQRVTHTLIGSALEENALYSTEDQRRAVIDYIDATISSATWAGTGAQALSTSPVGFPDVSNRSALDVYNDIARTEAGHLFCVTTGTLTAPVEQIQVRSRDRPQTPKATFDVSAEVDGIPSLVRDLTNVIEALDVTGPNETVTVTDPTVSSVTTRFITSGQSETILSTDPVQMQAWGYDRINRAKNVAINVTQFTVDAVTTPTDRSTDLLGLIPGDRVRVSGFPAARVGYSTWDGWLIGASEVHTYDGNRFTYTVAPCLPAVLIMDTDQLANAGDITLTASCTATDTTLAVTSATGQTFAAPAVCTLGAAGEQIRITAATATTLTVTRGYNGTTAIAHTVGAVLEVTPLHQLAF